MSSPSTPSDSRGPARSRPAPIHEVLARAKEGSLDDIRDLIDRVKTDYLMASEEFQETVSTILDIPKDVERFNPTLQDLAAVVVGLALLTEVAAWYGEGNTSSIHPKVLIAEDFAKKYLFWSLILLRIPATPTSSTSPLEVLPSARQLDNYYHVPALYDRLFTIPGILYQTFPQSLRSTLINIALVWWTALFEGEPPMYPIGRPCGDPHVPATDVPILAFLSLLRQDTKGMISSIMGGNICTPEIFVQRTLQRVRLLSKLNSLPHLSDLPPCTMEVKNIGYLCDIAGLVMRSEERLRGLFMRKGAPGIYMKACSTLGSALEARSVANRNGTQRIDTQEAIHIESLLRVSQTVVEWATLSTTSTLHHVIDVVNNGVVQLVGSGKILCPNEKQGTLDKVFETISLYASFSDVFPSIYKETMAVLGPSCPPLSTRDSFPGYGPRLHNYVNSARNLAFSLDIDGFNTMEYFAKKASRLSLCDNFKHYNRVSETAPEGKPQEEHACSRCHSVVYCSAECQREDWRAFHRTECAEMAKEYNDRKSRDQAYTYHDRAFQTSFLRYHYESLGVNRDRGGTPYIHGRDGVEMVDVLRPVCTITLPLQAFLMKEHGIVPTHILPRMKAYITAFNSTNGPHRGTDPAQIRGQNMRLLFRSFPIGPEDVNLLVLLKRVRYVAFDGTHLEKMMKANEFKFRGPEAISDYLVCGALVYTTDQRPYTRQKMPLDLLEPFSSGAS